MMLDAYTMPLAGRTGVNVTRWVPMMDLAQPVLDCIRAAVTEPLALTIRSPGRVGVYCFDAGPLAVCNYRNDPADVEIEADPGSCLGDLARLAPEDASGATIETHRPNLLRLRLPPRTRALFAPPMSG